MTKKEIKLKIEKLLGLKFSFGSYKTTQGAELKCENMEIGQPIYVITPEGELPVPEGEYELENGMVVKVKEGLVDEISTESTDTPQVEVESESEVEMTEATLVDGTKITNNIDADFEVGQLLYVLTEAGDMVPAPEGEHTTESGIVLVVDGEGLITGVKKPDTEGEGSMATEDTDQVDEMMVQLLSAIEALNTHFEALKTKQSQMEEKLEKFSSLPAGQKVFGQKGYEAPTSYTTFNKADMISKLKTIKSKK